MLSRSTQQNLAPQVRQNGTNDQQPSTVHRVTPTCVFLMKTSQNYWSFVTVCLKYKFRKVNSFFLNQESFLANEKIILPVFETLYQSNIWWNELFIFINVYLGFCMLLNKNNSTVDSYDCRHLSVGCPTSNNQSHEVLKCKLNPKY